MKNTRNYFFLILCISRLNTNSKENFIGSLTPTKEQKQTVDSNFALQKNTNEENLIFEKNNHGIKKLFFCVCLSLVLFFILFYYRQNKQKHNVSSTKSGKKLKTKEEEKKVVNDTTFQELPYDIRPEELLSQQKILSSIQRKQEKNLKQKKETKKDVIQKNKNKKQNYFTDIIFDDKSSKKLEKQEERVFVDGTNYIDPAELIFDQELFFPPKKEIVKDFPPKKEIVKDFPPKSNGSLEKNKSITLQENKQTINQASFNTQGPIQKPIPNAQIEPLFIKKTDENRPFVIDLPYTQSSPKLIFDCKTKVDTNSMIFSLQEKNEQTALVEENSSGQINGFFDSNNLDGPQDPVLNCSEQSDIRKTESNPFSVENIGLGNGSGVQINQKEDISLGLSASIRLVRDQEKEDKDREKRLREYPNYIQKSEVVLGYDQEKLKGKNETQNNCPLETVNNKTINDQYLEPVASSIKKQIVDLVEKDQVLKPITESHLSNDSLTKAQDKKVLFELNSVPKNEKTDIDLSILVQLDVFNDESEKKNINQVVENKDPNLIPFIPISDQKINQEGFMILTERQLLKEKKNRFISQFNEDLINYMIKDQNI